MKKYILLGSLLVSMIASAQLRTPSLSPSASVKQTIGLTEVEINYSRPSARGRVVFGELLPYNEFWRTGANAATKITFSEAVSINGQLLKKGSYTILTTPKEHNWEINWYAYESGNWNSYVKKEPLIKINSLVERSNNYVETFEMHFEEVAIDKAVLVLEWENTLVKIPILVNEKERILKAIERTMAGPSSFEYFQAALYLHETKTDLKKALTYIQKATNSEKALFFQVTREALILKDLGKSKKALLAAKRALFLSEKAGNNNFVRINEKIISELN